MDEMHKHQCLRFELETAVNLLKAGFGALQEIDIENDFYHLPHQLLASGFERLMKCYIALVYRGRNGSYPNETFMKDLGHDLERLLKETCLNYYGGTTRSRVKQELEFLMTNRFARECIRILSLFGKVGRYYNIRVITGASSNPIDPKTEWEALECEILDPAPYQEDIEKIHRDYFPKVHSQMVALMERIARAIAWQFTLGDHEDPDKKLNESSLLVTYFTRLGDNQLGTIDYRKSTKAITRQKDSWIRYSDDDVLHGQWPACLISKASFDGDWPFRAERVIVERRDSLFLVVYVDGYAFALNGAAASHFRLPDPHDAGVAILGRSLGPVTDIANALSTS